MQQKTDEQYVDDMIDFVGSPEQSDMPIIVDPSASSFITALKMKGYFVVNGKNDVLPGIRRVSSLFAMDKIRIHESCTGLISELELYVWDDKASLRGEEKPLKTNDHAPDALRYYCMTALTAYDIAEMGINNE
jgi:phage terminase large subunit